MPVNSTHPQYDEIRQDWQLMDDSLAKGDAIKRAGTAYLPKTAGMIELEREAQASGSELDVVEARKMYEAYKARAVYPLWVQDGLRAMIGLLSTQELTIDLPPRLQDLESLATSDGFGIKQLWLRTCACLLAKGRAPLVGDYDQSGSPFIAEYSPESAINWRESTVDGRSDLVLAVFEEQKASDATDEFSHDTETVYRVYRLIDGKAQVDLMTESGAIIDSGEIGTVSGANISQLTYLPIVYAGTTDNSPSVDEIPLLSMARAALKYYQLSADYYTSLHYTGHPQPVVTGMNDSDSLSVTGPMAAWALPEGANAYYMEFSGPGISATREAMTDQRDAALEAGARVMDVGAESGEARKARQEDQRMTLYGVAKSAAAAIEQVCRYLAEWIGADPNAVSVAVEPEFSTADVDAAMLNIVGNLRLAGEVPRQVLYEAIRKAGISDMTDDEMDTLNEGGDLVDDAA